MQNREAIKVFLSYSWTSTSHRDFVLTLAERLMEDGVHVILDIWDLNEGDDKYAFMEKMVTDETISRVLIISDKKYAEKADKKKGGVGTESQIISSEVYAKAKQSKFIPIVAEFEAGVPCLPAFLKSRIFIDLSDQEKYYSEYEKIVRHIYDKPLHKKPNLGTAPLYIIEDKPVHIKTTYKFQTLKD
jgi:hypothetical protein